MQVEGKQVLPLDPEVARANCALILALLFSGRVLNRFGFLKFISSPSKSIRHFSPNGYKLCDSNRRGQDAVKVFTSFTIPCPLVTVVYPALEFDEQVWIRTWWIR